MGHRENSSVLVSHSMTCSVLCYAACSVCCLQDVIQFRPLMRTMAAQIVQVRMYVCGEVRVG